VVTASHGGVLEIVEPERTALVVPPGDAVALAGALARLLEDPPRRAAMGVAAAASARARLDRRTMLEALHGWCAEIHARWAGAAAAPPGR
jgi:glycosyltransferase involved in cell wall biosynthesis